MEEQIRVIDENGLFDEIRGFLALRGVNYEDYRLIQADTYENEGDEGDQDEFMYAQQFIVPKEIAEHVERVVYSGYSINLTFKDKDGTVLLVAQNFHHGDWDKVTAFAFEDLNFHLEDIF